MEHIEELIETKAKHQALMKAIRNTSSLTTDGEHLMLDIYELERALRYIEPDEYAGIVEYLRSKENLENE